MKTFLEVLGVIVFGGLFTLVVELTTGGGECRSERCERLGHTWAC